MTNNVSGKPLFIKIEAKAKNKKNAINIEKIIRVINKLKKKLNLSLVPVGKNQPLKTPLAKGFNFFSKVFFNRLF